ncbi:MAG: VTT domain-containing protein [Halofilum sp. (in: g-proteobacteria)]|nr:VTT domain-containing protein [Halofilum sp. (in: g-proteobacteria)]
MTTSSAEHAGARAAARRRLLAWAMALLVLLALAAAWSWTPMREWIDPRVLAEGLERIRAEPWAPMVVLAGFLVGGLLVLPVTLMTVLTLATFGPVLGFVYALVGSAASAMLSFGIGRGLGRRAVEQLAGTRVYRMSRRLGRHGLLAIALLRMMPVAHFTVVSLSAGASHVRARDFLAGTALGMAPGLAAIALFFDRVQAAARQPDPAQVLGVLAVGAAIVAALLGLRALVRRRRAVGKV